MKQQSQQYYFSSTYLPTASADVVSTEATQPQNQNSNKSVNKFSHLNSLIEEFNKEFSQNNTIKNINLNDSSRYSFIEALGCNNIPTEPKENEAKFYRTTTPTNANQQTYNNNNTLSNYGSLNNNANEANLLKQLKKNEVLLGKAHDIINHFRTDLQMEKLTQQINTKIQMQQQNQINNLLNVSSIAQNQQNASSSFINAPNPNQSYNNMNTLAFSTNGSIGNSQQGQRKRNKSLCADCTLNTTLPTKEYTSTPTANMTIDLDLQDKLYQSNKNLQENIIKLNEANKVIKQLQDLDIKNKEQIDNYSKQYDNMKQKLKISLKKLKELKDRETHRETEISTIMQNYDNSQQLLDERRELERRLSATIKYNEDLFQNYSNILKINSELQNKILEYEQENLVINEQLKEYRGQMNILKQTEYKVENLEHNISRIEESSTLTVPELQKKVKSIQDENSQKIEIIGYCTEFVEAQLNKTVGSLQKILQDTDIPLIGMKNYLAFGELHETANLTKGQDIKKIIQKLDVSTQLQQVIQYICTISYAIVYEQINNSIQPMIQSIDRKILLVETLLPKLRSFVLKQKADNTILRNNASIQENEDLSSIFSKHKAQKSAQNQKSEFSKFQANSRQSLSFKKEQFDEFSYFNQENMGDFANMHKPQKDQYQMDLITNSMSSNHLFKIHDSPEKKSQDEELNLKLLQIINSGIKKYEDLSTQMNQLHQRLEIVYKNVQQNNSIEYQTKGELQKLTDASINLSKNIELSELYIKKELGIIKAEIDYNLKLQRQMELPKMM